MSAGTLVMMANDIANFFHAESDRAVAVDGIVNHIRKYWEPRMRRKIVAQLREGGDHGLNELARAAIEKLAQSDPAQNPQPA